MKPLDRPVRYTHLKKMSLSPAHYLESVTSDFEPTRPMRVGLAVHAMVLGGALHIYDGERRGNDWKAFEAAHSQDVSEVDDANQIPRIITIKEANDAAAIAEAVRGNAMAMELLTSGQPEELIEWVRGGRACRAHLDVHARGRHVVELKVTNDAHPDRFTRQAQRMGYLAQLDWYCQAVGVDTAYVVAVESKRPYPVTVMRLTPRALESGRRSWVTWWERLMMCEASNQWPEYCQSIVDLDSLDDDLELDFGGGDEAAA